MDDLLREDFMTTTRPKRSAPVRIGVCGGRFGRQFQWHKHPDCMVGAVAELDSSRRATLQETYQCDTAYESLEQMLGDKEIEAVAIFTGAGDHVRHVVAALHAGKHVISAVPAAQSLGGCEALLEAVQTTGLTYMLAETSYYRSPAITARQLVRDGEFGNIFYTEAEYHHPGIEELWLDQEGRTTWRYGRPPMYQSSHCTAYLIGVTGERLTNVACLGNRGTDLAYRENVYHNPYHCETALFHTDGGNTLRVSRTWQGAHLGCERAQWYGDKLSFFMEHPNGWPSVMVRASDQADADDAGFARSSAKLEPFEQPEYWDSEHLPEPMRGATGHGGSHTLLTHEFVDALMRERSPAVDVEVALAMAAAAVTSHQSAMEGGRQLTIPVYARTS